MEKTSISNKFIDRLELFMQKEGLNNNQITVKAGLSNGLIGKSLKKRAAMNSDSIEFILNTFPRLNADWLMTGRGEMLLSEDNANVNNAEINKYLDRIERLSEEVGRLKAEVDRLKSLLNHQEGKNCKAS